MTYVRNIAFLSDSSNVEVDITGEIENDSGDMCAVPGPIVVSWTLDPTHFILDP